jgi:hypothetical protein
MYAIAKKAFQSGAMPNYKHISLDTLKAYSRPKYKPTYFIQVSTHLFVLGN